MWTFKQFLSDLFLTEQKITAITHQPVDLFIGRFQPFHLGHAQILNTMRNPVVGIIKGAKTSLDKEQNPLSFIQQKHMIAVVYPNIPVFEFPVGYLPEIIDILADKHLIVKRVFAGDDRINGYKKQIELANKKAEQDPGLSTINIEFVQTPRAASATQVREFIRTNNYSQYASRMPGPLADKHTFEVLRSIMVDHNTEGDTK